MRPRQATGRRRRSTPRRELLFEGEAGFRRCAVYRRADLRRGMRLPGPSVVEQDDTTTIVYPGQEAAVDRFANLVITPVPAPSSPDPTHG